MVPNEETSQLPNRYLSSLSSVLVTQTAGLRSLVSIYIYRGYIGIILESYRGYIRFFCWWIYWRYIGVM